jgi:membrane-associated phospholipid phosphatase
MPGEMTPDPGPGIARLRAAARLFARPQPVTLPMVALFSIAPAYLVIGVFVSGSTLHSPDSSWDRALPLLPSWSVVYGSLFLAVFLPVFVVHQQDLLRRTILAYLFMWLFAFACFLAYPTRAPPHPAMTGHDFFSDAVRLIYSADVPYNCLPSLHVAQCALAAFVCYRVHRGVGVATGAWAVLVGLSTLFTKQHYVADVLAGGALAIVAALAALRGYPREAIPELERRLAPTLALCAFALYGLILVGLWIAYALGGGTGGLASAPGTSRGRDPAARSVSFWRPVDGTSGTRSFSMVPTSSRITDHRQLSGCDPSRA